MSNATAVFWFRRDLRLEDNAGLYHALKSGQQVLPLFIFDKDILDHLEDKSDKRLAFIYQEIERLHKELTALGSGLLVKYGKPLEVLSELLKTQTIQAIYTNTDYEPYAIKRDAEVRSLIEQNKGKFYTYKDQCIFEKNEIVKDDGKPYTVFTAYSRKWKAKLISKENFLQANEPKSAPDSYYFKSYPTQIYFSSFIKTVRFEPIPTLLEMGFNEVEGNFPSREIASKIIQIYTEQRNFPGIDGTSKLGIHFRFGTISIRAKARKASMLNETFLNELIWRDFYMQILFHFPYVVDGPFKPKYAGINWRNNEKEFQLFCEGKTGYPIVDAGIRELNATGFMHNRVRMIVASFLTKHLLIDWRWGEAYFANKLLDFDLSANNGGWQWAAGCGTDAAPYFRVFNPSLQTEKFDKNFTYIKKWVPEWNTAAYPAPIVNHDMARNRCLDAYKSALNE
ncbi:MAG: deoxyribodipyrimidine photolyase [Bacteroidetes bacterium B1(2017)]|nr:MAG: deoxyribodipyrimidine photolyase [Bacteroidetes bacterium B1(2017)]